VAEGGGWGEEFRHARAVAKRFRRPAVGGTSKQNNFQFLLKEKFERAGVKKLKENCFALLSEVRRAETRSGIIRVIFARKRFELRSAIATQLSWVKASSVGRLSKPRTNSNPQKVVFIIN